MTVKTTRLHPPRAAAPALAAAAALVLLVVALVVVAFRATPAPAQGITIIATPTLPALASAATVSGFFDYRDPSTRTAIDPAQIACVVGRADPDWVLVAIGGCDGSDRAWLHSDQVAAAVPIASFDDLSPRPAPIVVAAPAPAAAQPAVVYVAEPAAAPPPAAIEEAPPTFAPPQPTAEIAKRDTTGQKYSGETWHAPLVVEACPGWHPPLPYPASCAPHDAQP